MARLILTTPGEDVDVGGNVDVIGTTAGGEVITITRGNISLDSSFNAGGDTIVLPGNSVAYTVQLVGSRAIIASSSVSVSIPLGTAGTSVQFSNTTLTLEIESGAAYLGDQMLTSSPQPIEVDASQTIYGTNVIFEVEPNDDFETVDQIDRSLLVSSPDDPNLTDPNAPSVVLSGVIEDNTDYDFYAIYLNEGETITLDVDGAYDPDDISGLDPLIGLLDESGAVVAESDDGDTVDEGSSSEYDSYLTYVAPVSGYYYIGITSFDSEPGASPQDYDLLVSVDDLTTPL